MAKKEKKPISQRKSLRTNRMVVMLNDDENRVFERYVSKYKVKNKSKCVREILMFSIIRKLEEDSPTLFD